MKRLFFCTTLFLAFTCTSLLGQKYGYINLGNLVASLPESKAADSELKAYQEQLVKKGEEMAKAFQAKVVAYQKSVADGGMAPIKAKEEEAALQKEQQSILQYEQEVSQKLQTKRNELLKPIVDKATTAIKEVGKENGYAMIFDSSIFNAILYLEEKDDIMPLVKAKLGIQ